jgi:arylsulfatase A-like enzyme
MAIFAAMVEVMDRNIGRVIEDLRANRQLENTLVLFFSDNGACAEWDPYGFDKSSGPQNQLHRGDELAGMGQPGTYHSYGSGWANAAIRPGGCKTLRARRAFPPLIARWPWNRPPRHRGAPAGPHDLMPTFVELAGAQYHDAADEDRVCCPRFAAVRSRSYILGARRRPRPPPAVESGRGRLAARGNCTMSKLTGRRCEISPPGNRRG